MRPPKYPLEPLAELRRNEADAATGRLGVARKARDAAERQRLALEEKEHAEAAAAACVRSVEQDRLARGELQVSDLSAAGAWESGIAAKRQALEVAVHRARDVEQEARAGEEKAAREVVSREAGAQVVEGDRSRWQQEQRKRAEAKEDEAASEARRPRR
jgi:hypothetical protein